MEAFAFEKYEGLGNDFVVVEAAGDDVISPRLARALCDRRFGVGGDGVLVVAPPRSPGAAARMRVVNADGSTPEMCGNGLRCVALHVARARALREGELTIETDAGPKACSVDDREGRGEVTVDMGVVHVTGDVRIDLDGDAWDFTLADAGNPHAVTTRPAPRATVDAVGPRVATHARFPAGTNVEFALFRGREVDLVVWERGVGVTHACGTGACATVAVGVAKGWIERGAEASVHLPGGTLAITIRDGGRAIMRGPARHVFTGRIESSLLSLEAR